MSRAWTVSFTPSSRDSTWNGKPAPSPYLHKQLDITQTTTRFDLIFTTIYDGFAGWSSLVARWAHNPAVRDRWIRSHIGRLGVRTAMCGKITRQSRWNLSPALRDTAIPNQAPEDRGRRRDWMASAPRGRRYSPTLIE